MFSRSRLFQLKQAREDDRLGHISAAPPSPRTTSRPKHPHYSLRAPRHRWTNERKGSLSRFPSLALFRALEIKPVKLLPPVLHKKVRLGFRASIPLARAPSDAASRWLCLGADGVSGRLARLARKKLPAPSGRARRFHAHFKRASRNEAEPPGPLCRAKEKQPRRGGGAIEPRCIEHLARL